MCTSTAFSLHFQGICRENYLFFSHPSAMPADRRYTPQEAEVCFIHLCSAQSRWSLTSVGWVRSALAMSTAVAFKDSFNDESDITMNNRYWARLENIPSGPTQGRRTVCFYINRSQTLWVVFFFFLIQKTHSFLATSAGTLDRPRHFFQVPWQSYAFPGTVPGVKGVRWVKMWVVTVGLCELSPDNSDPPFPLCF